MTCHEFLSRLVDLARPHSPANVTGDYAAREVLRNAVRHTEECATCGDRLAEARNLSQRLQMVSSSVAAPKPQIRQELALRAAFRARQNVVTTPTELPALHYPWTPSPWKPWTIAIAAMLLATIAGTVALQKASNWFGSESPAQTATPATIAAGAPMEPARRESVQDTIPSAPPNREPVMQQPGRDVTTPIAERTAEKVAARASIHASTNDPSRLALPALAEDQPLIAAGVETSAPQSSFSSAQYETMSEFIPLLYGGDPMLSGSGPVVRVEMSGVALQTLGFPLVEEPSARRVKADLMLGEDGMARAIRFVQ